MRVPCRRRLGLITRFLPDADIAIVAGDLDVADGLAPALELLTAKVYETDDQMNA